MAPILPRDRAIAANATRRAIRSEALSNRADHSGNPTNIEIGYKKAITDTLNIDFNLYHQKYESSTYFKIFPNGYNHVDGVEYTEGFIGVPSVDDTNYGLTCAKDLSDIKAESEILSQAVSWTATK